VPAILFGHLILFGVVEALVTALIILYFQKSDLSMLSLFQASSARQPSLSRAESVQAELKFKTHDSCSL
jgi:hypothetical protein